MADNVTDELNRFWQALKTGDPKLELGGIYANKSGYHNTRNANSTINYSVRDWQDKLGPGDKAAAIDITFPEAQRGDYRRIGEYCRRLEAAKGHIIVQLMLREYYGQTDSDREVEGWDFRYGRKVTSDDSHLWHIHLSFNRGQVNNLGGMLTLTGILLGTPIEVDGGDDMLGLKHGDKGDRVKVLQLLLERWGKRPDGGADGDYGDSTARKLAELVGGDGRTVDPGTYVELLVRL